jgi:hypothetical protein
MQTREERRLAKQAAWRASRGLQPKQDARAACLKRATLVHKSHSQDRFTGPDPDGFDRDNLGLSPDY